MKQRGLMVEVMASFKVVRICIGRRSGSLAIIVVLIESLRGHRPDQRIDEFLVHHVRDVLRGRIFRGVKIVAAALSVADPICRVIIGFFFDFLL